MNAWLPVWYRYDRDVRKAYGLPTMELSPNGLRFTAVQHDNAESREQCQKSAEWFDACIEFRGERLAVDVPRIRVPGMV